MTSIQEFMTKNTISIEAGQPIAEAAKLMRKHDIGMLPVTREGALIGVVTDRDIVVRAVAERATEATVGDVVTGNPVIVSPNDDAQAVVKLMSQYDVRRLPVAEQGTLVGVVSVGDLATRAGSELAGTVMKNTGPLDRPVARNSNAGIENGSGTIDPAPRRTLQEAAEHGAAELERQA